MRHVFVYGTLMYEPVWRRLVNKHPHSTHARLDGYRRFGIHGQVYPGIVETPGHVDGILYFDLDNVTIHLLDEFEAEYYERIAVQVVDLAGKHYVADTYIIRSDYQECLDESEWDQKQFERSGLRRFLDAYQGFDTYT